MNDVLKPVSISADRGTRLVTVIWEDEHKSIYPFGLLRKACPCASCRGGHEYMSADPDPVVFSYDDFPEQPENRMTNLEAVGSYAVSFHWEDGHQAGIYNWHYLRALCPCEICQPKE